MGRASKFSGKQRIPWEGGRIVHTTVLIRINRIKDITKGIRPPSWGESPSVFGPARGRDLIMRCQGEATLLHAHSVVLTKHFGKAFDDHVRVAEEFGAKKWVLYMKRGCPNSACKFCHHHYG